MKKFSIKSLLVLVLALVLALSMVLVACNKDEEPEEEAGYTASEYFARLWSLSKSIGNEEIKEDQNIAVSADLGLELAIKSMADNSVTKKVALGIAIDAVLDRHNLRTEDEISNKKFNNADVSKDTALKLKVYDAATGENWATVYYFMGDAGNLYIDFAGQNIVLPFDYANDQLGSWLSKTIFEDESMVVYDEVMQAGYVYEKVENSEEYQKYYYLPSDEGDVKKGWYPGESTKYPTTYYKGKAAIGSILSTLSAKMGADWNLNVLVNDVFSLIYRSTQMDLVGTVGGVAGALKVPQRDIYDANGNLNLEKILTSGSLGKMLFGSKIPSPVTDANGVTTYRAPINTKSTVLNTVLQMAGPLLTAQSALSLEFQEKDNAIQNFSIKADLKNLKTSANEYPALTVSINELKFRGVDKGHTSDVVKMATEKDKYSTDVNLDLALALDVDGLTISPSAITNRNEKFADVKDIVLDGQLVVSLKGKLDLKNKDNNKTAAVASIAYQAEGGKLEDLLTASFVGNRLAVTLNQDLKVKTTEKDDNGKVVEVSLAQTLVSCFGGYVFDGIKGWDMFKEDSTALDAFANVFFAKNADETLNKFALNPEFKGGVWDNVDLVSLFQKGVNFVVEKLGGNGLVQFPDEEEGKAKTAADTATVLRQVANTITKVIPLFTTGTDGITVTVDNVNNVVANIGREFDDNMSVEGNVNSIVSWDNGSWIPDIAKLLVIDDAKYNTEAAQKAVSVTDADIEAYKNAERTKYAYNYYTVTDERVIAAREDYKNKGNDYIRKALAGEDFKAAIGKEGITQEEYKAIVTAVDEAILKAETTRFIGKDNATIIARAQADEAFMAELLSASAVVKINMSGKDGFSLTVNANVANAKVGISLTVGASKVDDNNKVTDLGKDVTKDTAGWFYFAF